MLLTRAIAAFAAACAAGCPLFEKAAEPCAIDGTTELGIVIADQNGNLTALAEMGEVPLIAAPQGGHILLAAPRIKMTTATCEVQVTASLRDLSTNIVIGLEQRPIRVHQRADGWATPPDPADLSDLANVAVCPSSVSMVAGIPARLEVKIVDPDGSATVTTALDAIPTCGDSQYCVYECNGAN